MTELIWKIIFIVLWVGFIFIRGPHTKRYAEKEKFKSKRILRERVLVFLIGFAIVVLPLVYVFTGWLDYFNMNLPEWSRWVGVASLLFGLILLWWVHKTLGENWSPVLEIREEHDLITEGPYKYMRHPMHTFFWIWVIGQWLVLSNWFVGIIGVAPWAILYFTRVESEEEMMMKTFGEKYKNYMKTTRRLLPKWRLPKKNTVNKQ